MKKLLLMNCRPPRRSRSVLGSGACCMRNLASPPCPRSQNTAVTFCKIARLSNTNIINIGSVEFVTSYAEVSTSGLLVCYCQCCKCCIQGGTGGREGPRKRNFLWRLKNLQSASTLSFERGQMLVLVQFNFVDIGEAFRTFWKESKS